MRFYKKLLIFMCAAVLVAIAIILNPVTARDSGQGREARSNVLSVSPVTVGAYSMEIDPLNLNATLTKNGSSRVWNSGTRAAEDGFTSIWANKVTDGFTIGYRDANTKNSYERAITSLSSDIFVTETANGYDAAVTLFDIGISFTAKFRLDNLGMTVEIPFSSIKEYSPDYVLAHIIPFNYFDNTAGLVDGYTLLPDGSGALIDLSQPASATQSFSRRIYGADKGVSDDTVFSPNINTIQMPMYAMYYPNTGGHIALIESGAEYAQLNAQVMTSESVYNHTYFKFIYREEYIKYFESAGTDGRGVPVLMASPNKVDLKVRYIPLDENQADLGSVSTLYREYLLSSGKLKRSVSGATGLRLEYLMAESKPSMFGSATLDMTAPDFINRNLGMLSGITDNLNIALLGYTRGGLSGSYPKHFPLEGGSKDYKKLISAAAGRGINLSFVTDYARIYPDGSGYRNRDTAMSISEQFIYSKAISNSAAGLSDARYMLSTVNKAKSSFSNDLKEFKKLNAKSLDFNSIGGMLYSGYKNQAFTRTEQINAFRDIVGNTSIKSGVSLPNQYLWDLCSAYLDTPITHSAFLIENEEVPFLQMVLSGSMDMYRMPLNLNYLGKVEILRMIDYNVYPAFLLTQADTVELYGTQCGYIFTSKHSDWIEEIKDVYNSVAAVLDSVAGCKFLTRTQIEPGVYINGYDNGVEILVNYTNRAVNYAGKTFSPNSGGAV